MAKSVRGTFSPEQIQAALRQGDSPIVLMAKGSFTAGHAVVTDADGNAVDGGVIPGDSITVNGVAVDGAVAVNADQVEQLERRIDALERQIGIKP